jgi:hypothetical protein
VNFKTEKQMDPKVRKEATHRPRNFRMLALLALVFISAGSSPARRSYYFDGKGISREVLENYLDKSITMAFFLVPEKPDGKPVYPYHADDTKSRSGREYWDGDMIGVLDILHEAPRASWIKI